MNGTQSQSPDAGKNFSTNKRWQLIDCDESQSPDAGKNFSTALAIDADTARGLSQSPDAGKNFSTCPTNGR